MNKELTLKPGTTYWPPDEIKAARHALGLTVADMARMLETDTKTMRCLEAHTGANMYRPPAPRMVRLLEAYLAGYRPADWPTGATAEAQEAD